MDHNKLWKILKEMGIGHLTCLLRNLMQIKKQQFRTRQRKMDWFKTGKGVCQGCILSPCLFNLTFMQCVCVGVCVYSHSVRPDLMDCILQDFSVHGILQARIQECIAIPFSRGSSQPRDWTWVSCIADRFLTLWAIRVALYTEYMRQNARLDEAQAGIRLWGEYQ